MKVSIGWGRSADRTPPASTLSLDISSYGLTGGVSSMRVMVVR